MLKNEFFSRNEESFIRKFQIQSVSIFMFPQQQQCASEKIFITEKNITSSYLVYKWQKAKGLTAITLKTDGNGLTTYLQNSSELNQS
jgi:hypothetical protein